MLFSSEQQYDNTPSSYDEITASPVFALGTPENQRLISEVDDFQKQNTLNASKQIAKYKDALVTQRSVLESGGDPNKVAKIDSPQDAAFWYSRVGRDDGSESKDPNEMLTGYARQRAIASMHVKRLQPYIQAVMHGQQDKLGKKISNGYGEDFVTQSPETWADLLDATSIDGVPAFANETEKRNFIAHSTRLDKEMGTSAYHQLQLQLVSRSDTEGHEIFQRVKSSDGTDANRFRFTMDEQGEKDFDAYKRFYQRGLDSIHQEQGAWHMPKMLIDSFGDMLYGAGDVLVPEDQISEDWRKDPAKMQRVTAVFAKLKAARDNGYNIAFTDAQTEEQKALVAAGKLAQNSTVSPSELVITDPNTTAARFMEGNMGLVREIVALKNEGAFNKESRIAPLASMLDGLLVNTTFLGSLFVYSTDPTSFVSTYEKSYDLLFGGPSDSKEDFAKWMKRQEMQRVNEAIFHNEEMMKWSKYGILFRTNGGAPGESYLSDTLNDYLPLGELFQGNSAMLKGAGVLLDPFIGASMATRVVRAARRGFTRAAIMDGLLRTTQSLEGVAKFGSSAPSEIAHIVDNVRQTLKLDPKYANAALNDMDVLDAIARGNGRIVEVAADGTKTVRELSRSELIQVAGSLSDHGKRIRAYISERQKALAKQAAKNEGKPISLFGKWVAEKFPNEILGFETGDYLKKVLGYFGSAEKAGNVGAKVLDVTRGTLPSAQTAWGAAKVGMLGLKGATALGVGAAISGGQLLALPTLFTSMVLLAPDIAALISWGGRSGKVMTTMAEYAASGKTIGGSVSALRIREIEAEIIAKEAEFAKTVKTFDETARHKASIEVLKDELATWANVRGWGFEKAMVSLVGTMGAVGYHGMTNELLMKANDRAATGGFALAGTFVGINYIANAGVRNVLAQKYRKDQQKVEFYSNLMKADSVSPMQTRRILEWYNAHKKAGLGDRFIQALNNLYRGVAPGNKVTIATPAEINGHMTLLRAADMMATAGKDPWAFRQGLMDEAALLGLKTPEEINAYVATHQEKAIREQNARQMLLDGDTAVEELRLKMTSKATDVEAAIANESAAIDVLTQRMEDAGIPTKKKDGSPVNFSVDDLKDAVAFGDALRRELGIQLGSVEGGKIIGLLSSPDFASKFKDFRIAFTEHAKVKTATQVLSREFGEIHAEFTSALGERQRMIDEAGLTGSIDYRPGQIFAYYDKVTGTTGTATVVDKGMFIVNRVSKDGELRSEIILNNSEIGITAMQEEFAHRLFTSTSFNNMRTLLKRDLFGDWGRNVDGTFEMDPSSRGSLLVKGEDGKYDMPLLRLFAQDHASKLSPEDAQMFMMKVDKGIKVFNENPLYGQHLLLDVTNELWAKGYIQRLAQTSPTAAKLASDVTTAAGNYEGSTLIPNKGDSSVESNTRTTAKMTAKLLAGELTLSDAANVAFKALLEGKDESQLSVTRSYELKRLAAKIAAQFASGGTFDKYMAKSMKELLQAQGVDPEFFGAGSWHNGKLFTDKGVEIPMPDGIKQSVDRTMYAVRRSIEGVENSLYETQIPYDSNGNPLEEFKSGDTAVLWAARNNKLHYLDKTNKLRNLREISYESKKKMDAFSKLVFEENAKGEITGFRLQKTEGGIAIGGRITAKDAAKILKLAKDVGFYESHISILGNYIGALADADQVNPSSPMLGGQGRVNRTQKFILEYGSVTRQEEGSPGSTKASGGTLFKTTRSIVPISVRIEMSGLDELGSPIFDEAGNRVMSPTIMMQVLDLDAFSRRVDMGWNGLLINEKGNAPYSAQQVQSFFGGDKQLYAQAVRTYLENLSMGGEIKRNKKDTKTPPKTSVESFVEFAVANGLSPTKKNAEIMAQICNLVVGTGNSNYVRSGERPDYALTDTMIGMRKFYQDRNFSSKPAMRDSNFVLMDIRLDRTYNMSPVEGQYFPWGANSWNWANVAFQPAGWKMIKKEEESRSLVSTVVSRNPDLAKSLQGDIGGVWSHPVGYTVLKQSDGKYHVYDAQNGFVTYTDSLGNAQDIAFSHAKTNPTAMNLPFDRQVASELGLKPIGMGLVNAGQFTRRQIFTTPDNRFQLVFNSRGSGSIIDTKNGSTVASNIRAIAAEGGRFDISDIQAAFKLAYDNLTLDAPVMDLNFVHGEGVKPGERVVGQSDLEFIPVKVGRNVQGKMVYASTNPAYYAAKRKIIDMFGRERAVKVLERMKAELGDKVIGSSPSAVANWTLDFLNGKMSKELEIEWNSVRSKRNMESIRLAEDIEKRSVENQLEAGRKANAQLSTRSEKFHQAFTAPVQRILFGINEAREKVGLEPIISISPAQARVELSEAMVKFKGMKDITSATMATTPEELQAVRLALKDVGSATTDLRAMTGRTIAATWRNSAGFVISAELMEPPTLSSPYGATVAVGVRKLVKTTGLVGKEKPSGGTARIMYRIYNPAGGLVANCTSQKEAADRINEEMSKFQDRINAQRNNTR